MFVSAALIVVALASVIVAKPETRTTVTVGDTIILPLYDSKVKPFVYGDALRAIGVRRIGQHDFCRDVFAVQQSSCTNTYDAASDRGAAFVAERPGRVNVNVVLTLPRVAQRCVSCRTIQYFISIVQKRASVDFMNFTYYTNPCHDDVPVPVVMRKGKFSYYDKKMVVDFYLHVDSVKKGSMQPGTGQAVVVLACDFPVGGVSSAYLYDEHGNTVALVAKVAEADWGGDWGQGPDSIHVRFANNLLHVSQCSDDNCAMYVDTTYALHKGKLAKISERTHKPRL